MVERVTRFGVSLPRSLLKAFDDVLEELGYASRSKALSEAVTDFISSKKLSGGYRVVATISYVYDHHVPGVNARLVEVQHGFESGIASTMHSHMSRHECVEVLIVEGETENVRRLFGSLGAVRGVKSCKLSVLSGI